MATFKRNAIIAGYINSYCLACECFFETEEQTFFHIKEDEHEMKLQLYPYIEKYGNNCIRKVKAGYFCEHCSLLMATAAKVNLHVAEKLHYSNKGNSLLKQSGSVLTAFDDILISESAWHSFADDACSLCDIEFDSPDEHKVSHAHVMKLLQNKIEFGENNNLYRKIDKNNFQCLTCNCMPQTAIEEHFNEEDHKQKYLQCQEDKKKYDLANPMKVKKDYKIEVKPAADNVNNVETITGNDVTETPKKAQNTETENEKIEIAKQTEPKKEPKIVTEIEVDPATYAKENNLTYDPRNVNAFCKICQNKFPSTLYNMKAHVTGRNHINKTAKAAKKTAPKATKLEKKMMENFVQSISVFDKNGDISIIMNESICISEKSCHFFMEISSQEYICQICLVKFTPNELYDHCALAKHEKSLRKVNYIMNVKNEFIREIRPETFHCGFCNLVLSSWSATEEHLKTSQHKMNHAACQRRLHTHLPFIQEHKKDEEIKTALFHMVLRHMNN